jgi:hypothetical protein
MIEQKFWDRVAPMMDDTGCWEWLGGCSERGYAVFTAYRSGTTNENTRVARFSYELHHGPVPEGLMVCHTCDNRSCVNPAHLYAGTATDNNRDTVARNRHRWQVYVDGRKPVGQ